MLASVSAIDTWVDYSSGLSPPRSLARLSEASLATRPRLSSFPFTGLRAKSNWLSGHLNGDALPLKCRQVGLYGASSLHIKELFQEQIKKLI